MNFVGDRSMRNYIRHPSDIPIEFETIESVGADSEQLNNISEGGLSFNSSRPLHIDSILRIHFPFGSCGHDMRARVKWCKNINEHFEIGVQFLDEDDLFRLRMVEQVCHIEHYKRKVKRLEGRDLSGKDAAMEWIELFAGDFPQTVNK